MSKTSFEYHLPHSVFPCWFLKRWPSLHLMIRCIAWREHRNYCWHKHEHTSADGIRLRFAIKGTLWSLVFYFTVCNQTSFTDLLLLVDSSSNISKAQFQRTRSFIIPQLIMAFKLSHSNIKLALVSYHSEVNVLFDFTNCYTTDNIRSEVNKLLQTSQEGDTAEAIKFSKTFFTSRYGSRVNATKYVILFSNGNWSRTSDVIDAAETTKDVRLSVIVTMTPDERQNDNAGQCLDNVLLWETRLMLFILTRMTTLGMGSVC